METLGAARLAKEIPAQRAVATTVRRDEITAVLQDPEASPELFLRVTSGGVEESDEPSVIAMTWSRDELEGLLERATGENVVLTFDRDELSQAIGDVEAHGLRERALVFAVAATSALGTGTAIANAMPAGDDAGPVVTSIAPAVSADSMADAASSGSAAATTRGTDDQRRRVGVWLHGPSGADGSTRGRLGHRRFVGRRLHGSGGGGDLRAGLDGQRRCVGVWLHGPSGRHGRIRVGSMVTDVSSAGGYGTVASTGSSGGFLDIHQPGGTTDGLIAGSILLAIAGATFASRRSGTARPA